MTVIDGIWCTETGPIDGPTLVMVHGSLDRATGLSRLARRFDDRYRVIRIDRRGYGRSADHDGPFTVDRNIADLINVVERLAPESELHFFGHSFGGNVVLGASTRFAERTRAVALFETPLSWQPWWGGGSSKGFPEQDPRDSAEAFMRRLVGDSRWERLPERTREARRAEGRVLVGELSDLRSGPPWRPEDITVPVLALCGSRGADHHKRAVAYLSEVINNCVHREIDGAGHGAPNSHPVEVAEVVDAFFSRQRLVGGQ